MTKNLRGPLTQQ